MKNMQDISNRAKAEIEQWFPKQCQNPFIDYYWWYIETTPEHDGGFLIAADRPINHSYAIAGQLGKHLTKEQNLYKFLETARTLPILEYAS
ncbi:MAG: hypothetical protein ACRCX2_18960 [Paraclostridium sp.]